MREIKFRVWSSSRNIFIVSGATILQMINECDGDLELAILLSEGGNVYQQYTGLKDINGKEIYEGDVIKSSGAEYDNENFIGEVCYDFSYPGFVVKVSENDYRVWFEEVEVIGNIYENPELLK